MKQQPHRLSLRLIAVGLVITLLLAVPSTYYTAVPVAADEITDKRDEIAQLQKEQQEIEEAMKNLGDDIQSQQAEVQQLYKKVSNMEKQVEAYESQLKLLDRQIADQEKRIEELNVQIAAKESLMEEILTKLKKRVKAIAKTGNYSSFQILMNTENYQDYLLKTQIIKCVSKHDDALIDKAEQEKQAIIDAKKAIEDEKTATETTKAEQEKLKADLDKKFESLDGLYRTAYNKQISLEKKLGTYEARQKKLEKAEQELEREIEALLNTETSETYGGKMYWPVPAVKQISCSYGQKPTYFHGGTDIWGPAILKKNIVASADGVVVKSVKMHYSYGNYVMVDHGFDSQGRRIMTLYAHMYAAPKVSEGQKVYGGSTVLGLVGSTGNSTGPHLHFEVRVDGKRVDPVGQGYIARPK